MKAESELFRRLALIMQSRNFDLKEVCLPSESTNVASDNNGRGFEEDKQISFVA